MTGLSVGTGEVGEKVRVRADEAVPDIQHVINLVAENRAGLPQCRAVIVGEQDRLFEHAKVLKREAASEPSQLPRRCILESK